jgi:hypothetical protein
MILFFYNLYGNIGLYIICYIVLILCILYANNYFKYVLQLICFENIYIGYIYIYYVIPYTRNLNMFVLYSISNLLNCIYNLIN